MKALEKLEIYMEDNDVAYLLKQHPQAFTARDVAAIEHISPWIMAKVVMVVADGKMVMTVLSANTLVDLTRLSGLLGARVIRLAEEMEFQPIFADCEPGAMPPFGNLYNLPVYVDRSLADEEFFVFQAGTHKITLRIAFSSYEELVKPVIGDFGVELKLENPVNIEAYNDNW
jgi:Ala-tRNA(Pro) deacylase